jgi:hypothetical protein
MIGKLLSDHETAARTVRGALAVARSVVNAATKDS